jgi:membrane-bound lytic murein transglycosylase D
MKKRFGFASRNFYASFLAILEVERNAAKYLGPVSWSQPLEGVEVKTRRSLKYSALLDFFEGNDMKLQIYNPHINKPARTGRIPIPKGAVLSLPKQKVDEFLLWDKTRKK